MEASHCQNVGTFGERRKARDTKQGLDMTLSRICTLRSVGRGGIIYVEDIERCQLHHSLAAPMKSLSTRSWADDRELPDTIETLPARNR